MRRFLIEVVEDENIPDSRAYNEPVAFTAPDGVAVPCYRVMVGKDAAGGNELVPMSRMQAKLGPAVVAAHEIGHVLAHHFECPADVNAGFQFFHSPTAILEQEQEAWAIAEFAFNTFAHIRTHAVRSYQKQVDNWSSPFAYLDINTPIIQLNEEQKSSINGSITATMKRAAEMILGKKVAQVHDEEIYENND